MQVSQYIVRQDHMSCYTPNYIQARGWEPGAVRQWLLSAGWKGLSQAPDAKEALAPFGDLSRVGVLVSWHDSYTLQFSWS